MDKNEKPAKATKASAEPKNKIETFDISNSAHTMALAIDVAKFIQENKLYQNIQGKEFVNVEGWQYAGSRLGIFPIIESVVRINGENEIAYESKCTLLNTRTGQTVGAGFAVCSNKENGKKYYQEFAIASMAQTRAIGKGFRLMLAWVIRAAGYEPTPAEEMDYQSAPEVKAVATPVKAEKATTNTPPPLPSESKKAAATKTEDAHAIAKAEAPNHSAGEAAAADNDEPVVKYATAKQKEEIIRLLNNVVITRQEKTKMLLNINKLDEERAAQSIKKLRQVIEEREEQTRNAGDNFEPAVNPENLPISESLRDEMISMVKQIKYPAKTESVNIKKIDEMIFMDEALEFKALLQDILNALGSSKK